MKDIVNLANYIEAQFDLAAIEPEVGYVYEDLALGIIDAVFSIGVRYGGVINVINRYKKHYSAPHTIGQLLDTYAENGVEGVAENIFENRQRTSTRNGILKADAVYRYAQIMQQFGAESNDDVLNLQGNTDFESAILAIPGQSSGIALTYLYMLCGEQNLVKPDRQIIRFIDRSIGETLAFDQAGDLLIKTTHYLQDRYPNLTPRALDHEIWKLMSNDRV